MPTTTKHYVQVPEGISEGHMFNVNLGDEKIALRCPKVITLKRVNARM